MKLDKESQNTANDSKDNNDILNNIFDDKKEFGIEIGSRIKYARSILMHTTGVQLNNKRLALELHVSPSKITSILNGQRPPSLIQLKMLANLLHVSTDYLLGLEKEIYEPSKYKDIQKLTGLTRSSISSLIAFQNENNPIFETDVLFGKYNISYFNCCNLESTNRIPLSIYNYDYSKSIANGSISFLKLNNNLEYKLFKSGFFSIAELLSSRVLTIKKTAGLSDGEMIEVKRALKKFLKNRFHDNNSKPQAERAQNNQSNTKTIYELRFLNSIINLNTLTHMEEITNSLLLYESEYKNINRLINELKNKQKQMKNSSKKTSSKLASEIDILKSQQHTCRNQIDYYRFNLYKVIEGAIDYYIQTQLKRRNSDNTCIG